MSLKLALFKWLVPIAPSTDLKSFDPLVVALGLEIDQSISSQYQRYASDPSTQKVEYSQRVSILITRCNKDSSDVTIEVRSSEPMLRKNTRCELKAKELQAALERNH
jgi:hypothetical protein